MARTEWGAARPRHTCRSQLIDGDAIAIDARAERREIERQDAAFVERLRLAILAGRETAKSVLGIS